MRRIHRQCFPHTMDSLALVLPVNGIMVDSLPLNPPCGIENLSGYFLTISGIYIKNMTMQTLNGAYKFIGKILPDGHLSIPAEVAKDVGKEFEVLMVPTDEIKSSVSLYLEGRLEKKGSIKDLSLDSAKIEDAIKKTFGTADIDAILENIRR